MKRAAFLKWVMLFLSFFIATISFSQEGSLSDAQVSRDYYLLIGTYTNRTSEGIYVYKFDPETGGATAVSKIKTDNPSFLAISPQETFVYAVNENGKQGNPGSVAAFSFDKNTGTLRFMNKQLSGGNHPCYVSIDNTGKWVTASNYTGGSVAVLPVKENGEVGEVVSVQQHVGSGIDKKRQEKPHVHSSIFSPDYRYLLVSDLGIDKVIVYKLNKRNGRLTPASFIKVQDGEGPRHLSFHPSGKFVYLLTEMGGNIIACRYHRGRMEALQTISSYPGDYKGSRGAADIHVSPDGRFLYTSNRMEANSIAIYSIDQETGKLKSIGYQATGGKTPRNFNFDPIGNFLLVANQDSGNIVIFKIDRETGLLSDTGKRIEVDRPVCIKWISNR